MTRVKRSLLICALSITALTISVPAAEAKGGEEYGKVVSHLKKKYKAKKVKIPFMWLARFAVGVVRPAGVKSFNVTLFEKLEFSRSTLDQEMQAAMKNSLGPEWSPILRVRSRAGQQVYMNMRESGSNIKLMLVAIDTEGAAIVRATVSPERLVDFVNDPKVFGISLNEKEPAKKEAPVENSGNDRPPEKKIEATKDN